MPRPQGGGCQEKKEKKSTDAALILRRFEGGWPWLLTKRICLGGGMVGLIAEAIAEAHSWQAHHGLRLAKGKRRTQALGRRATPTRRSPWTVESAMRGAPGAVGFSLDFFLGWRRKQQSVRIWRRGGGALASGASRGAPNFRDGGGGASRVLFDPLWGLGAALEVGYRGGFDLGDEMGVLPAISSRRAASGS